MPISKGFVWSWTWVLLGAAACGGGDSKAGTPVTEPPDPACVQSFDSTYAAIQEVIFEKHGCTQEACHGTARSGGLDLRAGASYASLVQVASTSSPHPRVQPGEPSESYLLQKLAAATRPGSVMVAGSPMPSGLPPLSENELEAVRLWIQGGAPESGSVGDPTTGTSDGISGLLDACLPPAGPVTIEPLEPPAADEGVQFVMPSYALPASSEIEVCFASYYDFSSVVPAEDQDPARGVFYVNGSRLRQDPQSHHIVMSHSGLDASWVNDPTFGAWTCTSGPRTGETCDPTDLGACGDGVCASEVKNSIACIGFGPPEGALDVGSGGVAAAQTAQQYLPAREGLYREVPLRGILYWNSHAFNLTGKDHTMNARVNLFFADERKSKWIEDSDDSKVYIAAGQPPFTIESYCADHVVEQGARVFSAGSHTHKRGKRVWVEAPDGTQIYESLLYSDPVDQAYEPPLEFDSPDPAERTLRYCVTYNNGVKDDGSPDPSTVTRASRMPERASCVPTACAAGQIGAACSGADDDATCDSSPGAGDGECDACAITAGVTTENEMFIVTTNYFVP